MQSQSELLDYVCKRFFRRCFSDVERDYLFSNLFPFSEERGILFAQKLLFLTVSGLAVAILTFAAFPRASRRRNSPISRQLTVKCKASESCANGRSNPESRVTIAAFLIADSYKRWHARRFNYRTLRSSR